MANKKEYTVTYKYVKTDDGVKMLEKPVYGGDYSREEIEELTDYVLDTELSLISGFEFPAALDLQKTWESYKDEKRWKRKTT